jgi:hypothetical protein
MQHQVQSSAVISKGWSNGGHLGKLQQGIEQARAQLDGWKALWCVGLTVV